MPTLGTDCHLTLSHPSINGGAPVGFLLEAHPGSNPHTVAIQRETDSDGVTTVRVFFTVLAGDELLNPDGSWHASGRSAIYAALIACLAQTSAITLQTSVGTLANLGAIGHCATEAHTPDLSKITVQLSNAGSYYPPADPATFNISAWDGTLTWQTSYWR
jgi:hypothetical protein